MHSAEKMDYLFESVEIIVIYMWFIMTLMVQTFKIAIAMAVLFGVGLIISNVGPIASASDQETANKQLDEALKSLDSGDNAGAEGDLIEANSTLAEGQAKTEVGEAITALQAGNITGAQMEIEAAQGLLGN
jgi:cellobiose-specific phosphotransferase system component IIA